MKKFNILLMAFAFSVLALFPSCHKDEVLESPLEDMVSEKRVELFTEKADDLYKLNLVWGELKYFHPLIVSDDNIDWDRFLIDRISYVIEQDDPDMDTFLLDMVKSMGEFTTQEYDKDLVKDVKRQKTETDALYFLEDGTFSRDLVEILTDLSDTHIPVREKSYCNTDSLIPEFKREKSSRTADFPSLDDSLLCFFRLWNVVNYYYPYKDRIEPMKELFYSYLDDFVLAETSEDYTLAVLAFLSELKDSNVQVMLETYDLFGTHVLPFELESYFDSYIVMGVFDGWEKKTEVMPGDILVSINGKSIAELKRERGRYISVSNEDRSAYSYMAAILSVDRGEGNEIGIIRHGEAMTVTSGAGEEVVMKNDKRHTETGILDGNIGYIEVGEAPSVKNMDNMMSQLRETDGLIIDMRRLPGTNLTEHFPSYFITKDRTKFCSFTTPDPQMPGSFLINDGLYEFESVPYHYDNDVVILTNEFTIGHGEFALMLLREAKNVTVMGSTTNGTDGNIVRIPIPGGYVGFSVAGIYEKNMDPVQGVGIKPDIEITLDPALIREGRDQMIEEALEYLR